MYAILHIPTGHILHYSKSKTTALILPITDDGKQFFYSKQDAEKYKRRFLCFYYFYVTFTNATSFPGRGWIPAKQLPAFAKKRNRFDRYPMTFAVFDLTCRNFEYYPTTKRNGPIVPAHHSEFLVIKVS